MRFFMPNLKDGGYHEIAASWFFMLARYRARTFAYQGTSCSYLAWLIKECEYE